VSTTQIIGAVFGFLIIAMTLWKIIKGGIARSNGQRPEFEDKWMNNDWPG
jgi:hypothetical protein